MARENGWSHGRARRVVEEYRRFLFLACSAGHPVTPSDAVDQAWHLHLAYTRSYWEDLCGEVLGRPLHHGPTRGGPAEGAKFRDWYARTLASYEGAFGSPPPSDIWPAPRERFAAAPHFRRVNTRDCWVIPRPNARTLRRALPIALITAAACGLMGALPVGQAGGSGVVVVVVVVVLVVVGALLLLLLASRSVKGRGDGGDGGGMLFWELWRRRW